MKIAVINRKDVLFELDNYESIITCENYDEALDVVTNYEKAMEKLKLFGIITKKNIEEKV